MQCSGVKIGVGELCGLQIAREVSGDTYLLLCAGRGAAAVFVTSKKKAIVVPGSTPPRNHEFVPLQDKDMHMFDGEVPIRMSKISAVTNSNMLICLPDSYFIFTYGGSHFFE